MLEAIQRFLNLISSLYRACRSQWPCGLRRRPAAARLLRLWVRTPPGAWMTVCCESCVLSGRGLCNGLITRPEESYRLWCVVVWSTISWMRRPWPALGRRAKTQNTVHTLIINISPTKTLNKIQFMRKTKLLRFGTGVSSSGSFITKKHYTAWCDTIHTLNL